MANKTLSMDAVKEKSLHIYNGMTSVYPFEQYEAKCDFSSIKKNYNGCYSVQNSTVCFVYKGEVYVTPCTDIVLRSLNGAGLTESKFDVPFSSGDYPKEATRRWAQLKENMIQAYIDDFLEDCITYSDANGIKALPPKIFQNCLQIPFRGVPVKGMKYETCYYPVLNIGIMESEIANYIGTYNLNKGVVVFVYRDGKTYVTKGFWLIHDLKRAGYVEKNIFVPFSEGEMIRNKNLQKKWASIKANVFEG